MNTKTKIAFNTLGCKLNFSETSSIARGFEEDEYEKVDFSQKADIYVINSCSVTRNAEKRCKVLIRQAMRLNPEAYIAVVGCYSQINPEELASVPGVKLILGNADKYNLHDHIQNLKQKRNEIPLVLNTEKRPKQYHPSYSSDDRTRSFFKIQDGCDYFCSYCTIPLARGFSRSDTIEGTIKVAREISNSRMREIVLTGVNIGEFGKQHGESFYDLLKELVKLPNIDRIRISSIEPNLLNDDIIDLVAAEPVLMPHFHIPLQSGSDDVLKDMGRRYDARLFASRVEKIKKVMPWACVAIDVIVGFPSEDDKRFQDSYKLMEHLPLSYLHVFTYSERDHTRAVNLNMSVPVGIRNERSKALHLLSDQKKKAFVLEHMHTERPVLFEKDTSHGFMFGFTDNYLRVKTPHIPELENQIANVKLEHFDEDLVYCSENVFII